MCKLNKSIYTAANWLGYLQEGRLYKTIPETAQLTSQVYDKRTVIAHEDNQCPFRPTYVLKLC